MFTGQYSDGNLADVIKTITARSDEFAGLPLYFAPVWSNNPSDVTDAIVRLIRDRGCRVVILDYIQSVSDGGSRKRDELLSDVAGAGKSICSRHGAAFVCCSQLTVPDGKNIYSRPNRNWIRGSKSIGHKAGQIILLWRKDQEPSSPVWWTIDKSKIGNVGRSGVVTINDRTGMFEDLIVSSETQRRLYDEEFD
jgi:replicative DNA helicase